MRYASWIVLSIGLGSGTFATLSACTDLFSPINENANGDGGPDDNDGSLLDDGGLDDPDAPPDLTATILSPEDFLTGPPGIGADFTGKVSCPAEERPCTSRWALSTGQTADGTNLGRVNFPQAGWYQGYFTARGRSDASVTAQVHVGAWGKTFSDNFNRPNLDPPVNGWRIPSYDTAAAAATGSDGGTSALYGLEGNWLRITGDIQAPGTTAFLAYPKTRDGRGTFKQRRQASPLAGDHYTDLVFRYDPARADGHFYRMRVHEYVEQGGLDRGEVVELALFRIIRDDDQHGHLINNRGYYWENPTFGDAGIPPVNDAGVQSADLVGYETPPGPLQATAEEQCHPSNGHPSGNLAYPAGDPGCPTVGLPAQSVIDRFRVEVVAAGTTITFKLFGYKEGVGTERLLLADKITDTAPEAITEPGLWGMAHFAGVSYMDDFSLTSNDP